MHIAMSVLGMEFNGATIPEGKSLGGSESAGYYMARCLSKMGHDVTVWTTSQQSGVWDGVKYEWCGNLTQQTPLGERFHITMQAPHDVVIIQRTPWAFRFMWNSKLNIWWLHDIAMVRAKGAIHSHLFNIDQVLTVSEWHKNQVAETYGIKPDYITATHNGMDYDLYSGFSKKLQEREPRSLVYASRPERGLENLVKPGGIMEQLPDSHLYVCGYDNTVDSIRGFYEYLWGLCRDRENVTYLGALGKKELGELIAKCQLYVYPTYFEDTSCMVALEANACGTPFIAFKTAALPETMKDAGAVLLPFKESDHGYDPLKGYMGQEDLPRFANAVKSVLNSEQQWMALHEKALKKRQTWESAAIQWDQLFTRLLTEKSSEPQRMAKHLERYSDIVIGHKEGYPIKDIEKNYHWLFGNDQKKDIEAHYKRYYEYERDIKGVIYGPEDLSRQGRFQATLQKIKEFKPDTVLDYACAHGHYTINLAKNMPEAHFVGVDHVESNIETAKKWRDQEKLENTVELIFGDHESLPADLKFDVILMGEVLEHVPDYRSLVKYLIENHLEENGHVVITLPYGPWESIGYAENPGWRAHIHNFERMDLLELFGQQDDYRLVVLPAPRQDPGEPLGNWLLTFKPNGNPIGRINEHRKLRQQAPRETVSLCMIVRDAEATLARTINKALPMIDEIIIAVDEKTKDNTRAIAEKYDAKVFDIPSPLNIGFDEARNLSIKQATCDWILWLDTDESIEKIHNLWKYLRPNTFNGYAMAQHHFGIEPAAIFKTDWPVRLFRNHKGIKFFGVVHEHPELDLNKGIGEIMMLADVGILHIGYPDEAIRKKRFARNWPLMQKDREKYPDRWLGRFLWIRDCSHVIRYELEHTGGNVTPLCVEAANHAVEQFTELIKGKQIRMVLDAIPFYSEAVKIHTQGKGINFAMNFRAEQSNGVGVSEWFVQGGQFQREPIVGLFIDHKDIKRIVDLCIDQHIEPFGFKYF